MYLNNCVMTPILDTLGYINQSLGSPIGGAVGNMIENKEDYRARIDKILTDWTINFLSSGQDSRRVKAIRAEMQTTLNSILQSIETTDAEGERANVLVEFIDDMKRQNWVGTQGVPDYGILGFEIAQENLKKIDQVIKELNSGETDTHTAKDEIRNAIEQITKGLSERDRKVPTTSQELQKCIFDFIDNS